MVISFRSQMKNIRPSYSYYRDFRDIREDRYILGEWLEDYIRKSGWKRIYHGSDYRRGASRLDPKEIEIVVIKNMFELSKSPDAYENYGALWCWTISEGILEICTVYGYLVERNLFHIVLPNGASSASICINRYKAPNISNLLSLFMNQARIAGMINIGFTS